MYVTVIIGFNYPTVENPFLDLNLLPYALCFHGLITCFCWSNITGVRGPRGKIKGEINSSMLKSKNQVTLFVNNSLYDFCSFETKYSKQKG